MSRSVRAYEALAGIYDHVMRHVDYDSWAAYLGELLNRYDCTPASILDIACGTGSVSLALRAQGLPVTLGVDQSEAMLRVARERTQRAGHDIAYEARAMDELAGLGPFDAAVCMYDSLNYLLETGEVEAALRAVYGVLNPRALFVFDVCTERNSLCYFQDFRDDENGAGFAYQRHSHYDRATRVQHTDFIIRVDGFDTPVEEHHQQRIYRLDDMRAAIGRTGFELLGMFDGFGVDPGSEDSERVHFVLRRPNPGTRG